MIKIKIMVILIINLLISQIIYSENMDYKNEMRNIIKEIRNNGKEKIIVGNGGISLYFNSDILDREVIKNIDGILVESVYSGYNGPDTFTPDYAYNNFMKYLSPLKDEGVKIFILDYSTDKTREKYIEKVKKDGVVQENAEKNLKEVYSPNSLGGINNIEKIADVNNFLVLLQYGNFLNKEGLLTTLSNSEFDLLIIDPYFNGKPFMRFEIERLKYKKNGKKRIVLGYMSIGEAETYRKYWSKSWEENPPSWIYEKNKNWENNYIVKYWTESWKNIVRGMQGDIDKSGFDGYFLDTIDTYQRYNN